MGLFRDQGERDRVDFGEDWIDIKAHLTYGDRSYAQEQAMKSGLEIQLQATGNRNEKRQAAREMTAHMSPGAFNMALLERAIVAWSDERPVSREHIAELPEDVVAELLERIDSLSAQRTEEEKAPLGGNSQSPSPSAVAAKA